MAKSITRISLIFHRPNPMRFSLRTTHTLSLFLPSKFKHLSVKPSSQSYSTTATPYPLQYDLIISRPAQSQLPQPRRRRPQQLTNSKPIDSPDSEPDSEIGFDDWVDKKLKASSSSTMGENNMEMDKEKRKYYNKRRKRMYGSDSEDENHRGEESKFVELKPEVVDFRTLHKREEELYFYDTFAYPWEKDKHYKMVYQLEKKYFPDQCFDKAFLQPGESNENANKAKKREKKAKVVGGGGDEDKGLVFFEEGQGEKEMDAAKDTKIDVSEKKVEEFFKCLKKVPNKDGEVGGGAEPYIATRSTGLPPKWDGPTGTMVLVNKPKGE